MVKFSGCERHVDGKGNAAFHSIMDEVEGVNIERVLNIRSLFRDYSYERPQRTRKRNKLDFYL